MRINGSAALRILDGHGQPTRVIRRPPSRSLHSVESFEPRTSDIPASKAGTVRATVHGRVTGQLGVEQGATNGCGPLALWLALGQFGRATQDWHQLDDELRPWSLGTSPGTLIDGARSRGLQAQLYNHGTFFDLERETEAGRAILVMTDVGGYDRPNGEMQQGVPTDLDSHWMRVTRAWEDSLGHRWVEYENPWGTREVIPFEQFDRLWRNQRLGGIPTGYDRAYVLIDRPKAKPLPPTNAYDVVAITTAADGAQTLARGVDSLVRGKGLEAAGRLVGGLSAAVLGGIGTLLAVPGEVLIRGGDALLDLAHRGFREGGLAALGGAIAGAAGVGVRTVGMIANAVGNAVGLVGQAVSAMVQGALAGLARLFG